MAAILVDFDQVATIMQAQPGHAITAAIQAPQHVGVLTACAEEHLATADARVTQQQHARPQLPLDQAQHTAEFALLDSGDLGVKDDVGATFHQQHTARLRKGTAREFLLGVIGKDGPIGIAVRQVLQGAIGRQHPQAKAKGRSRLGQGHRAGQTCKQLTQRRDPQLLAPLAEGSSGGHLLLQAQGLRQAFQQAAVHFACAAVGIERQGDDQVDHGLHVQFVLALLPGLTVGEHLLDHLSRQDGFHLRQRDRLGGLALWVQLTYGYGHRQAPPCDRFSVIPVCHKEWPFFLCSLSFHLSKWYWGIPQPTERLFLDPGLPGDRRLTKIQAQD